MSKHTPGPWFVGPLEGKYYGTYVAIGQFHGVTVWTPDHYAEPFASPREIGNGWLPEDGHDHVEDVQSYANARLIAAAPDLLAAAQYAVAMEDEPRFLYEAIRDLRAAIAKATGENA